MKMLEGSARFVCTFVIHKVQEKGPAHARMLRKNHIGDRTSTRQLSEWTPEMKSYLTSMYSGKAEAIQVSRGAWKFRENKRQQLNYDSYFVHMQPTRVLGREISLAFSFRPFAFVRHPSRLHQFCQLAE